MREVLYITLINIAILCPQQTQADFAFNAGIFYTLTFGAGYFLSSCRPLLVQNELQKNPDQYKVTDELLINLIQKEADKRGLDFSKFIVVKNKDDLMRVSGLSRSAKYVFNVGSEDFLKVFAVMDSESQKAIVQHELNHILYSHNDKQIAVSAISHYIGFLIGYAALSMVANYTANYIEKNSVGNSSMASWIRNTRPFVSTWLGLYAGHCLHKKSAPVYSRYCEKQADLAIDDDPAVLKGFIKFHEICYYFYVVRFGQEFVEKHTEELFGKDHPTPLERIAYLKEKLQQCSNNES